MTVKVAYKAGIELGIMTAKTKQGDVIHTLGKADGLSRPYGWGRQNGWVIEMTEADAKVMQAHLDNGGLRAEEPRMNFLTGEQVGVDPEFLIGEPAIKAFSEDFAKRYGAYAEQAAELLTVPSVEIFTGAAAKPAQG